MMGILSIYTYRHIKTHIAGLVPGHSNRGDIDHNKVSHTDFWFPVHIKVRFTLYYITRAIAYVLKNNVYPLIKYFIAKICYDLSFRKVVIFLLVEGLKYKNQQNVEQRHKVSKCYWKNDTSSLAQCMAATNL